MRSLLYLIALSFSFSGYAGTFPGCPKNQVWNGERCVSICPAGYHWNSKGICTKDVEGASVCRVEENGFESVETGCKYKKCGLVFSHRSEYPMTFREAENYCHRVEAEVSDWRLPQAKDLMDVAGRTLAEAHFEFPTNEWFWTSTEKRDHGCDYGCRHHHHHRGEYYQKVVNLSTAINEFWFTKRVKEGVEEWADDTAYVVCVRKHN